MEKVPVKTQISAGGVAYRQEGGKTEVVLISVGQAHRWQLPKGMVDDGESPEAAGLREVREEAGVETDLIAPLETIEYWYASRHRGQPIRFHKFVHFFLMNYRSGDPADHDHEVNEARWVEIDLAQEMLTFESEKKVLAKAKEFISRDLLSK